MVRVWLAQVLVAIALLAGTIGGIHVASHPGIGFAPPQLTADISPPPGPH